MSLVVITFSNHLQTKTRIVLQYNQINRSNPRKSFCFPEILIVSLKSEIVRIDREITICLLQITSIVDS